tara:strand:- start:205 stop:600 length:396 start_codon:yes stop_codon:yes gene_type:complete
MKGAFKKPVAGDFYTPATSGPIWSPAMQDAMRFRTQSGLPKTVPESMDWAGYSEAMVDYEFRQAALENLRETFPLEDPPSGSGAPEAPKVGQYVQAPETPDLERPGTPFAQLEDFNVPDYPFLKRWRKDYV